jgi:hypothetical protein
MPQQRQLEQERHDRRVLSWSSAHQRANAQQHPENDFEHHGAKEQLVLGRPVRGAGKVAHESNGPR